MTSEFRDRKADEIIFELRELSRGKRRSLARSLLYKKSKRPSDKDEQVVLLDSLRGEEALTDFDRAYALIAASHKICENVNMGVATLWLDRLLEAEAIIRKMPIRFGLRKDRTHLVFSALNIALNLDLMTGGGHNRRLGDWFIEELESLNPKRMTPYLFNTTSNIVKCAGIVMLWRQDNVGNIALLLRRLVSYSIEINNPMHWWIYARFRSPSRIAKVNERAAFGSHCRTVVRLLALERAANESDATARQELLKESAYLCVAQATEEQREALKTAIG